MKSKQYPTFKTRTQLADELGISRKKLYNEIKKRGIKVSSGDLNPEEQDLILKGLGYSKIRKKNKK